MKKTFLLICLAAGLLSCTKELTPREEAPDGVPMNFEINIAGTKAGKTAWAENDVVYVFFNGLGEKYLKLTYDGSTWDNSSEGGTLMDTDFATLENNTLTAVHIPVPVNVFPGKTMGDFYINYEDDAAPFTYYFFDAQKAYSVDGTTVTASISLRKPEGFVLFHIPGIEVSAYRFRSPQMWAGGCSAVSAEGRVRTIYSENPNVTIRGIAEGDGGTFVGWLDTDGSDFTFTLEGPTDTYTYTCSDKQFEEGKLYNFPVLTNTNWTVTTTTYPYVDLDLPSGRMWATMNVGASTPEEYGDYFAWAETAPKETYAWSTLAYWNPTTGKPTYYTGISSSHLMDVDDAAWVNWGDDWRMPTKEDWQELLDNCIKIPVYSSDGTSVNGLMFLSESNPTKGIFLPANGLKNDESLQGVGTNGYYWSSDLNTETPGQAYQMNFTVGKGTATHKVEARARYTGCAVRPVK